MLYEEKIKELKQQSFRKLIENCTYIKKISNSLYGEAELVLHRKMNIQLILITKIFNKKEKVQRIKEESALRMNLNCDKILTLIQFDLKEVNELCSSFYRFQWLYEYLPIILEDQIIQRKQNKQHFTENEILNILDSILQGLQAFKQVSIKHGYFQPKHIVFNSSINKYLISDIKFMTQTTEFQTYFKLNKQQQNECYLSPELLKQLQNEQIDNQSNNEKNEIFSIGLTILKCMILQYPDIYNFQNYQINQQTLNNILDNASKLYSSTFIIQEMLLTDHYERLSLQQTIQLLIQQKYKLSNQPSSISQKYILEIDQSKENQKNYKEIKNNQEFNSIKNYNSETNYRSEKTPLKYNNQKYEQKQILTPITHLKRSPISNVKIETDISTISNYSYQDNSILNKTTEISSNSNYVNNTYRQITPERKTKPCPSPFKQTFPKYQQQQENITEQSKIINQKIQQQNPTNYDFVQDIKLHTPHSLMKEFSLLENNNKLQKKFNGSFN